MKAEIISLHLSLIPRGKVCQNRLEVPGRFVSVPGSRWASGCRPPWTVWGIVRPDSRTAGCPGCCRGSWPAAPDPNRTPSPACSQRRLKNKKHEQRNSGGLRTNPTSPLFDFSSSSVVPLTTTNLILKGTFEPADVQISILNPTSLKNIFRPKPPGVFCYVLMLLQDQIRNSKSDWKEFH